MDGYLRRGTDWWFRSADGSWLRWNPDAGAWEPGRPPPPAPGEAPEPGRYGYRSLAPLRMAVIALLAVATAIDAGAIVSDLLEIDLLDRIASGDPVTEAETVASDRRQGLFGLAQTGALIAAGIAFIVWLHRAYSNLPTLGAEGLRFRRWWTIGGWFIPIWAAFRPKQLVNDVWRASDPSLPERAGAAWRQGPVPGWWIVWWLAFVVSSQLALVAFRLSLRADSIAEIRSASLAYLISDSVSVVAGVLAILVVRGTTRRHLARAHRLRVEPVKTS